MIARFLRRLRDHWRGPELARENAYLHACLWFRDAGPVGTRAELERRLEATIRASLPVGIGHELFVVEHDVGCVKATVGLWRES